MRCSQRAGASLARGKSSFGLQNGPTGSEIPRGLWGRRPTRYLCPAGLCRGSHPSLQQKSVSQKLGVSVAMQPAVSTVQGWPRSLTVPASLLLPPPGPPGGLWTPTVRQKWGLYTLGCNPREKKPSPGAPETARCL